MNKLVSFILILNLHFYSKRDLKTFYKEKINQIQKSIKNIKKKDIKKKLKKYVIKIINIIIFITLVITGAILRPKVYRNLYK